MKNEKIHKKKSQLLKADSIQKYFIKIVFFNSLETSENCATTTQQKQI